jgi:hypothetical protein
MTSPGPHTAIVQFNLGAEHTRFEANLSDSLSSLKEKALVDLKIVIDPSIDYLLSFEGTTISDETQTLRHLLGQHPRPNVEFHIKKRPKGGSRR